jgi:rRNA maturation RNase YbeY
MSEVIESENKKEGEINYIFCDDEYLHKINLEYLNHDNLTDIISLITYGRTKSVEIFSFRWSVFRITQMTLRFLLRLKRVMVHGVLHYCGYKDKGEENELVMRSKEDEKLALFHSGTVKVNLILVKNVSREHFNEDTVKGLGRLN